MALADYAALIASLKPCLDQVDAPASFYSPLNVIGRLALGKWEVVQLGGFSAFMSDNTVRLIPQGDKQAYYQAVLEWSHKYTFAFVPSYMADVFRARGFKVLKQQTEYVMDPDKLVSLPGGGLRSLRSDRNRAEKVTLVEDLDPVARPQELLDLVQRWYAEAKDRLWRPSEKAHIDWLITHWADVLQVEPGAKIVGVRDRANGDLLSFEMGSPLTLKYASSFTQRSDRARTRGAYAGTNLLASVALAERLGLPVNDGPADHKELAQRKAKLALGTLDFYTVARK